MANTGFSLALIFFLGFSAATISVFGEIEIPLELQRLYTGNLDVWEAPRNISDSFPYYLSGYDEEKHPIWVLEIGKWDIRSAIENGGEHQEAFDKYVDQTVLIVYNSSLSENGVIPVIGIVDFEGYNLRQLNSPKTIEYIIKKLRFIFLALSNLQSAFVINTNYFAEKIINLVRPVLGKEFAKFDIYGTNPQKWKHKLLRVIPKDQLPSWYGRTPDFKPIKVYG